MYFEWEGGWTFSFNGSINNQIFCYCTTDNDQRCAPRVELAPFVYEMSLTGPIVSCIQADEEGRKFLTEVSNGEKGFIREDLRLLQTLQEISPVMFKVRERDCRKSAHCKKRCIQLMQHVLKTYGKGGGGWFCQTPLGLHHISDDILLWDNVNICEHIMWTQ